MDGSRVGRKRAIIFVFRASAVFNSDSGSALGRPNEAWMNMAKEAWTEGKPKIRSPNKSDF